MFSFIIGAICGLLLGVIPKVLDRWDDVSLANETFKRFSNGPIAAAVKTVKFCLEVWWIDLFQRLNRTCIQVAPHKWRIHHVIAGRSYMLHIHPHYGPIPRGRSGEELALHLGYTSLMHYDGEGKS